MAALPDSSKPNADPKATDAKQSRFLQCVSSLQFMQDKDLTSDQIGGLISFAKRNKFDKIVEIGEQKLGLETEQAGFLADTLIDEYYGKSAANGGGDKDKQGDAAVDLMAKVVEKVVKKVQEEEKEFQPVFVKVCGPDFEMDRVVELRIKTGGNTKTSQMALTQLRNIVKYSKCDFVNKIHEPLVFDDAFLKLTHLQRIFAETYDLSIGGGFKDKKNGSVNYPPDVNTCEKTTATASSPCILSCIFTVAFPKKFGIGYFLLSAGIVIANLFRNDVVGEAIGVIVGSIAMIFSIVGLLFKMCNISTLQKWMFTSMGTKSCYVLVNGCFETYQAGVIKLAIIQDNFEMNKHKLFVFYLCIGSYYMIVVVALLLKKDGILSWWIDIIILTTCYLFYLFGFEKQRREMGDGVLADSWKSSEATRLNSTRL